MNDYRHFNVEQVKIMFGAARPHERGALALLLFAGIRPETMQLLPKDAINVEARTIYIPGEFMRDGRSFLLETIPNEDGRYGFPGPPPILWKWLEKYPFQSCDWTKLRARLRKALGGYWIRNGCRNTAATYYSAQFGAESTRALLGQPSILRVKRLLMACTPAQADQFLALGPD